MNIDVSNPEMKPPKNTEQKNASFEIEVFRAQMAEKKAISDLNIMSKKNLEGHFLIDVMNAAYSCNEHALVCKASEKLLGVINDL